MQKYDVAVVGLGAIGSSAAYQLSTHTDLNVVGIDMHAPPHELGSSHGETRITRNSIGDGEFYAPLVKKSNKIWNELEKLSGEVLYHKSGYLQIGHPASDVMETTFYAAEKYGIDHEKIDRLKLQSDYSSHFTVPESWSGYYCHDDGVLYPEKCIATQLDLAKNQGLTFIKRSVVSVTPRRNDVELRLSNDQVLLAEKVIVASGAWSKELMPVLNKSYKVSRQVQFWFEALPEFPVVEYAYSIHLGSSLDEGYIYGFPYGSGTTKGAKIGTTGGVPIESVSDLNRSVNQQEIDTAFEIARPYLPWLSSNCVKSSVCMYSTTDDYNFVIDHHPENDNILLAAGFSGHGFKHSAGVGAILKEIIYEGKTELDISAFSLHRFE